MNTFGQLFKIVIFGESHGESVGVNIDGCPAGLALTVADFLPDMERRKGGQQKGTTPRKEDDLPIFKSGLFNDRTTGAPATVATFTPPPTSRLYADVMVMGMTRVMSSP